MRNGKFIWKNNGVYRVIIYQNGQYRLKALNREMEQLVKKGWIKKQYIIDKRTDEEYININD